MPDGMAPPGGAAPTVPGAAPPPTAPPTGPTGATMPVANQGLEALAMAKLGELAQHLQTILAGLPAGGDAARDVREALNKITKHVAPGGGNKGVQMTDGQRALMEKRQMGPQIAAQRAAQMGGGEPPPQGASGAAA